MMILIFNMKKHYKQAKKMPGFSKEQYSEMINFKKPTKKELKILIEWADNEIKEWKEFKKKCLNKLK